MSGDTAVKVLGEYVRTLPSPSNMDLLVTQIFGSTSDKHACAFKQSVLYYLNGTANGFLKYCTPAGNYSIFINFFFHYVILLVY